MGNTRRALQAASAHLEESMGARVHDFSPRLSPTPPTKDAGRKPLRGFGRVDIQNVMADPGQPREEFYDDAIERLAKSIQEKGQLSPIRVRWSDDHGKWVIIAGERRWRASLRAGLATVDCFFHEGDLSKSQVLEQQLIENCLREDLQPIEEAKAFKTLMELNGWTGKQVAQALRVPQAKVSRALALLKLPADVQEKVQDGTISARSAYELSKLKNDATQRDLAAKAANKKLTHEQAVHIVRQRRGKAAKPRRTKLTFPTESGLRVTVSAKGRATYLEVEQALVEAQEEVRHRIANRVSLD